MSLDELYYVVMPAGGCVEPIRVTAGPWAKSLKWHPAVISSSSAPQGIWYPLPAIHVGSPDHTLSHAGVVEEPATRSKRIGLSVAIPSCPQCHYSRGLPF